ncbi:MAG: ATP-binding protein [Candidatus Acidiferrales bacterium]
MSQEFRGLVAGRSTMFDGQGVGLRESQFRALAQLLQEINIEKSIRPIFGIAAEGARTIVGAKRAVVRVSANDTSGAQDKPPGSLSGELFSMCFSGKRLTGGSIGTLAGEIQDTTEMPQAESGPRFPLPSKGASLPRQPLPSAWLAVPLLGRDGRNIGWLGLFDKPAGQFTAEDETVLVLLAQFLSIAIENDRLMKSEEDERAKWRNEAAERKRLEDHLRQSQKMTIVGQLAGGIAHDFNNILTASLGYSELMMKRLDPTNHLYPMAQCIRQVSMQARELTKRLVAFSRHHVVEPEAISLNEIVSGIASMFERLMGYEITLVRDLDSQLQNVRVNRNEMEHAFLNLLVNACDAMPDGGTVTVRTSTVDLQTEFFREGEAAQPGVWSGLEVSDTGCGMDRETMAHIFDPFFSTKGIDRGSGLGLTMVLATVRQSGGIIRVESELGAGSRFRIYFPVTQEAAVAEAPELAVIRQPRALETILVAEDDVAVRRLLCESLTDQGYEILSAGDALEAIRIAESDSRRIDLLLTDLIMAGMNGRILAERFNQLRSESRVLFISGHRERLAEMETIDMFYHACLAKPFTPDTLVAVVREILDREIRRNS